MEINMKIRKLIAIILALVLSASFAVSNCAFADDDVPSWAIYMYLCGSDLESEFGDATENLSESDPGDFPDNLEFVIESGGTKRWDNDLFDATKLQRWRVEQYEGIQHIEDLPLAPMSSADTFRDFLSFCKENYPADNTMLIIWDHGGGIYGACYDENFGDNSTLSIRDISTAIGDVFGTDEDEPYLDIVNFDCCLMATVDMAELLHGCASYLIASEETMPGYGQNYEAIISALSKNPSITPLEYVYSVVDGYMEKCEENDVDGGATMSVTDLSRVPALTEALNAFAGDIITRIYSDPYAYVDMAATAVSTENYGGNSRTQGYYNLIDIRDFASRLQSKIPSAKQLMDAVDDAVICNRSGYYRDLSGGLSMYYSYNGDAEELEYYEEVGTVDGLKALYALSISDSLTDNEKSFIASLGLDSENLPEIETFNSLDNLDRSVHLNENGQPYVCFGEEVGKCITNVMYEIYQARDDGTYLFLGSDDEVHIPEGGWERGEFVCNFSGEWSWMGDYLANFELTFDSNDFNIYSIPITLDDGDDIYYLQIAYDFGKPEWENLGVRHYGAEPGMIKSSKLDEGQEFHIVNCYYDPEKNEDYTSSGSETLVYFDDMFNRYKLNNGAYRMAFKIEDIHKNIGYSEFFDMYMEDGVVSYGVD